MLHLYSGNQFFTRTTGIAARLRGSTRRTS